MIKKVKKLHKDFRNKLYLMQYIKINIGSIGKRRSMSCW